MDKSIKLQDVLLVCIDCNSQFIFSIGEQSFYKSKALSIPKRCSACRQKRKANLVPDENQFRGYREVGQMSTRYEFYHDGQEGSLDDELKQR